MTKPTPATAVAKIENMPNVGNYAIVQAGSNAAEVIKENLGGREMSAFDLDRIKFPSGGNITWEIPTLEDDGVEVLSLIHI